MSAIARSTPVVSIHYERPPGRVEVFRQHLIHDAEAVKVTFARDITLPEPKIIADEIALEAGSDVVWFTFPGAWHDIGRFHDAAGRFTGLYANVLTPLEFRSDHEWHTTDLFVDVWVREGVFRVLDEAQLEQAVASGWVDVELHDRAREEVASIARGWSQRSWPPACTSEWTRERALEALEG